MRLVRVKASLAGAALLLAGCAQAGSLPSAASAPPAALTASPATSATAVPTPTPPPYAASVELLPAPVVAEMVGVSWRPGCPVPLSQLRLIRLTYWGFDGVTHTGELVAHTDIVEALVRAFGKAYQARFPIRKMVRIDAYGGDDRASMVDDNTSGFNCRKVEGSTSWSRHAYGKAIDVNTVENPYVRGRTILPPAGRQYLDRSIVRPGMIVPGDVLSTAFVAEGFRWGGAYRSLRDYQHFEKLT